MLQKLLYSLHTAWIPASSARKLDGFHARCLRSILKVPHAYLSRVSNAQVLQQAGVPALTQTLRERQLKLFGELARKGDTSLLRQVVFQPGTLEARRWPGLRRQGRPRQAWATSVRAHAVAAAGCEEQLAILLQNTPEAQRRWAAAVRRYCYS